MSQTSSDTSAECSTDRPSVISLLLRAMPGLLLCGAIAGTALTLHTLPFFKLFSPMIVAVIVGIGLNWFNLVPRSSHIGLVFAAGPFMRFAIILLGFQLTWEQIQSVGLAGAAVIVTSLATTLIATIALGKLFGVDRKLAQLIAVGTSICGASAIVAANIVTRASDEDVAYALACVTFCGTIAMFAFPAMILVTGLDGYHYGLWTGAAIHEVGQVVGAAFQGGQTAGEFGTIAKLTRVVMLAPIILALGLISQKVAPNSMNADVQSPVRFPPFILIFLGVVTFNSFVAVPAEMKSSVAMAATTCLTMALAAIGLASDVRKLRKRGLKPLLLGISASIVIAGVSLALLKLLT
jgi:uncharacterized integral membrane protein (TIGR00698 family)